MPRGPPQRSLHRVYRGLGLPYVYRTNHWVQLSRGWAALDFALPELIWVWEADGFQYPRIAERLSVTERDSDLAARGWQIVRLSASFLSGDEAGPRIREQSLREWHCCVQGVSHIAPSWAANTSGGRIHVRGGDLRQRCVVAALETGRRASGARRSAARERGQHVDGGTGRDRRVGLARPHPVDQHRAASRTRANSSGRSPLTASSNSQRCRPAPTRTLCPQPRRPPRSNGRSPSEILRTRRRGSRLPGWPPAAPTANPSGTERQSQDVGAHRRHRTRPAVRHLARQVEDLVDLNQRQVDAGSFARPLDERTPLAAVLSRTSPIDSTGRGPPTCPHHRPNRPVREPCPRTAARSGPAPTGCAGRRRRRRRGRAPASIQQQPLGPAVGAG